MNQNLLICFLITVASDLFGTDLRDVIAHPEKFENQRITVMGVARVPGYFYLCPDEKAATDRHPENALLVRKNNKTQPEYREMDRMWVQVTGVVTDKKRDGYEFVPRDFAGHGICMEGIRILRERAQPRIKDDTALGAFKNSTAQGLSVQIIPKSEGGALFYMKPGDVHEIEISEGRVVALHATGPKNVRLYEERGKEKPVASGKMTLQSLPRGWEYSPESSQARRLYFRIVDNRVEQVAASEGRSWKRQ
jgi:hypothetical protein